jgi:hypothetical protein
MKHTFAERDSTTTEPAPSSQKPTASPASVAVYTFVIWDHDKAANVVYPRMATLEAIRKVRGKVNEESAWVVDGSELDSDGFYPRKSSDAQR